jgi:acetyl esterase/lipase
MKNPEDIRMGTAFASKPRSSGYESAPYHSPKNVSQLTSATGLAGGRLLCCFSLLLLALADASAAERLVIPLWPEGVPNLKTNASPEKIVDGRISNIHQPALLVFRPDATNVNGTAVIFCSGGGYVRIAVNTNGDAITRRLNAAGVTVFALKYRLSDYGHPAPLQDVLRAIRTVRSRAAEFGIETNRIGVMGASAGGHLAACAATWWGAPDGKTGAQLDAVSARPDFAVLIYPVIILAEPFVHKGSRDALLGKDAPHELLEMLSVEKHVRTNSPPVFIAATMADQTVPVENSLSFYQALRNAGVPAEMHVYAQGSHGNSLDPKYGPTSEWLTRCEEWMRFSGWLAKPASAK